MWTGLLVMGALAGLIAAALLFAASRLPQYGHSPADQVNALLPQIQCGQCGYPGCRPYADAIIAGDADINQCAPGGEPTVKALADCLDRPVVSLNPAFGEHRHPSVAVIDEAVCIGCARCLDACPVDAILGAHRFMHTVIESECTGCELCVPVCPVDCIDLTPAAFDPWAPHDARPAHQSVNQ